MAGNLSPEERLFKVIKEGKASGKTAQPPGESIFTAWLREFRKFMATAGSRPAARAKTTPWGRFFSGKAGLPDIDPASINKVLAAVLVITAALVAYSFFGSRQDTVKLTQAVSRIKIMPVTGSGKVKPFRKIEEYIDEIRRRDIFHPGSKTAAAEQKVAATTSIPKASGDLRLKGIAWGETPKAMILVQGEEKDGKIYFLVKGQTIGSTGITVKEIFRSKVVVTDGKEDMELL